MAIHGLFGLAHVGLFQFHSMCVAEKMSYAVASATGVKKYEVGEDMDPYVIVVISALTFLKIAKKLKKRPVCVFVIDNPIQLESINATILSCTKRKSYQYSFHEVKPSEIRMAVESCGNEIELKIVRTRVVHDLLAAASADSILSPLQNAVYRIRSVEERASVQDVVFDWVAGKFSNEKMGKTLKGLSSREVAVEISDVLKTAKIQRLRTAASYMMKGKDQFPKVASKYRVPLYDLKYVCKKAAAKLNLVLPG